MNIYLDDTRITPEGFVRAYTHDETIKLLVENQGKVKVLSLDHDLGDDEVFGTGYTVLKWLEEKVFLEGFIPPDLLVVHSANPVGVGNMERAISQIQRFAGRNPQPSIQPSFYGLPMQGEYVEGTSASGLEDQNPCDCDSGLSCKE